MRPDSDLLPMLPILLPLGTAILLLLLRKRPAVRDPLAAVATLAIVAADLFVCARTLGGEVLTHRLGGWPPPFGILVVADSLNGLMLAVSAIVSGCAIWFGFAYVRREFDRRVFLPLFMFQVTGINGAFLTGDIFNLFVFFEVMLMSTYCLISFLGEDRQIEAALKTITMSLVSSTLMLTSIAILYAMFGTLNMAHLAQRMAQAPPPPGLFLPAMLLAAVFCLKGAMIPLHFWLPDAHSSAPTPVSAMLSGLVVKVGMYGLLRMLTLLFLPLRSDLESLLTVAAPVTIVLGALGAFAQTDYKRMLAYSTISQIGYILLALSFGTQMAISAALLYIVNHAIIKAGLFLTSGLMLARTGSVELADQGRLIDASPASAAAFLISAMALAGLPPTNGFFSKFAVIQAGLASRHYLATGLALAAAFITLMYIMRAWQLTCWAPGKAAAAAWKPERAQFGPVALLAGLCLALGLGAGPLKTITDQIGFWLLDPTHYLDAVKLAI